MSIVNQYNRAFIGQTTGTSWSFYLPQIPKTDDKNWFEVEVVQLGIRRAGASSPHDLFFFAADIQGVRSGFVGTNSTGTIDSRVCLGMVDNYDTGAVPAKLTSPGAMTFRIPSFQPFNPFTVAMFKLSSQANVNFAGLSLPSPVLNPLSAGDTQAVLTGKVDNQKASFIGKIDNGAGAAGTTLTVSSVVWGTIAIGQVLSDTNGLITPGTTITGGSGLSWTVSTSQLVDPAIGIAGNSGFSNVLVVNTSIGTIAVGQTLVSPGVPPGTTLLGTLSAGVAYTLSANGTAPPLTQMITTTVDTVSPCQFMMMWNIKEMSP